MTVSTENDVRLSSPSRADIDAIVRKASAERGEALRLMAQELAGKLAKIVAGFRTVSRRAPQSRGFA